MTFEEYQKESRKTAIYPNKDNNFIYPVLGLCGESGEIAEKIKKVIRDKGGIISESKKEEIKKRVRRCALVHKSDCGRIRSFSGRGGSSEC